MNMAEIVINTRNVLAVEMIWAQPEPGPNMRLGLTFISVYRPDLIVSETENYIYSCIEKIKAFIYIFS